MSAARNVLLVTLVTLTYWGCSSAPPPPPPPAPASLETFFVYSDTVTYVTDQTLRYSLDPGVPEGETRTGSFTASNLAQGQHILRVWDEQKKMYQTNLWLGPGANTRKLAIPYRLSKKAVLALPDSAGSQGVDNNINIAPPKF